MFEVVTRSGKIRYRGTRKACWRYCEMYDRYAEWSIRRQESR